MGKSWKNLISIISILIVMSTTNFVYAKEDGRSNTWDRWRDGFNRIFHKDDRHEDRERDDRGDKHDRDDRDEHGCREEKNGKKKCKPREVPEFPVYGYGIVGVGAFGIYYYGKKSQLA